MHDVDRLLRAKDRDIHVIGLFAQEYQPEDPSGHFELVSTGYDDNPHAGEDELKRVAKIADQAADLFSARLRAGKSCLSSCAAGLNRSGLVSALTLMKVAGMSPGKAVKVVQQAREPQQGMSALCNRRFVELIHAMAPVVGSRSAWTVWQR